MSRFKKLINIIYYLIAIFVLFMLLAILYSTVDAGAAGYINRLFADEKLVEAAGLLGLFVLIVVTVRLIAVILKRPDDRYLFLYEDSGTISISDTVVEKTVINALKEFEEVIEYTVKIRIKNKNSDKAKVNVNVKCGLDEAICEAKGYYADRIAAEDTEETAAEVQGKSSEAQEKSVEAQENSVEMKKPSDCEVSESVERADEEVGEKKEAAKEFPQEIMEAMSVIAEDSEEESKEEDEKTEDTEKCTSEKEKYMNIDDLCSDIQLYVHETLQNLLSQRVDKVNIKFYEVRIKEKTSKGSVKNKAKKKNGRVN